ncbi:MAG: redoxin domain-containing protein [Thermoanaerobaculales bacterium]|nr:redoxin domain-containing protein [Thermoanaerobaculales bacterium]
MGGRDLRSGMNRDPEEVLHSIMKNQLFPTVILVLAAFVLIGSAHGGEMLNPGDAFPEFELTTHDDSIVRSTELEGTLYLIYYYPKADTPGCTKESLFPIMDERGLTAQDISVYS